jgi:hypothetical protein
MRLDEDKLETLRRWGYGLRQADTEESVAAGRAILMLIDEIERLRLELLRGRDQLSRTDAASSGEAPEDIGEPVASTLHGRLQRALRRDAPSPTGTAPEPVDQSESSMVSEETTTSPQAWIETLRRQR